VDSRSPRLSLAGRSRKEPTTRREPARIEKVLIFVAAVARDLQRKRHASAMCASIPGSESPFTFLRWSKARVAFLETPALTPAPAAQMPQACGTMYEKALFEHYGFRQT
jgi:hypothetical protein